MKLKAAFCFLLACLFPSWSALGQNIYAPYPCMSLAADYVIISKVVSVSKVPVLVDHISGIYIARLKVLKAINGVVVVRQKRATYFSILLRAEERHEAKLAAGDDYLLFISNTVNGPHVLNGAQGAVPVVRGHLQLDGKSVSIKELKSFLSRRDSTCKNYRLAY